MNSNSVKAVLILLITSIFGDDCTQVEVYECTANISGTEWQNTQVPSFSFDVTDTTKEYNVYVVLRHTNLYPFRNLWLDVGIQNNNDTLRYQKFELQVANSSQWLGTGMKDVYEHRAPLFPSAIKFPQTGKVTFHLKQIMRRNPLPGVLQVGIRVQPASFTEG